MSATVDLLFAEALELSEETRLELVERLIPTLHSGPAEIEMHNSVVARRIEEVRSGKVQLIDGDEAFKRVKESLEARRKA